MYTANIAPKRAFTGPVANSEASISQAYRTSAYLQALLRPRVTFAIVLVLGCTKDSTYSETNAILFLLHSILHSVGLVSIENMAGHILNLAADDRPFCGTCSKVDRHAEIVFLVQVIES